MLFSPIRSANRCKVIKLVVDLALHSISWAVPTFWVSFTSPQKNKVVLCCQNFVASNHSIVALLPYVSSYSIGKASYLAFGGKSLFSARLCYFFFAMSTTWKCISESMGYSQLFELSVQECSHYSSHQIDTHMSSFISMLHTRL